MSSVELAPPEPGCVAHVHSLPPVLFPGVSGTPRAAPQLIRLICNAALAQSTGGLCLLLPRAVGLDHLVGVLGSLTFLPRDSSSLAAEQITRTFKPGQKVRALPDGYVYRVDEPCKLHGLDGYWLNYLDAKRGAGGGRFAVWGGDLRRLEPTERSRPMGPDRKLWSKPTTTVLDHLAGAQTFGNHALLTNRIIVIGSRAELESFLESTTLLPSEATISQGAECLASDFPWGGIDGDGSVFIEHPRSTPGEPLIAASRNVVAVRKACEHAGEGHKLVVSRWVEGCLQNFEALSRIAQRQRVLLLADASSRDRVAPFVRDGWVTWEPTPAELLGQESVTPSGLPCIDRNAAAAKREETCRITFTSARAPALAECYEALCNVGDAIRNLETDDDDILDDRVEECVAELWSMFLEAAGWLSVPGDEPFADFRQRLAERKLAIAFLDRSVQPTVIEPLRTATNGITKFIEGLKPEGATSKGETLIDQLGVLEPSVLFAGTTRDRDHARTFLDGLFPHDCVLVAGEEKLGGDPQCVVAISLIARKAFARLLDPCPSSAIEIVGYDFEEEMYRRRLKMRDRLRKKFRPDLDTRRRLSRIELQDPVRPAASVPEEVPDRSPEPLTPSIERVASARRRPRYDLPKSSDTETELSREGRLVRFRGCSWSIFTGGHSITVVEPGSDGALTRKTVEELQVGDRLLLREAGEKDVIRLLAEDLLGSEKYGELWTRAQHWRGALRQISSNPHTLWQELSWVGLHRDPLTIRNWLLDDGMIGPRSRDDLDIIVEKAGERPDDPKWKTCWDAIVQLRTIHMRAGSQLTKILEAECSGLLFEDFEHEQPIDLSLGLLWLVEIDQLDPTAHWPSNMVNQLQWGRDDWRDQMMRDAQ